jgi:hypothetical protein
MYKGYPQPWRTWLLILIIVQLATSTGWVLVVVLAALVAVQFGLARYARRQP